MGGEAVRLFSGGFGDSQTAAVYTLLHQFSVFVLSTF